MTMPGLPKKTPAAEGIRINDNGDIDGLFKILVRSGETPELSRETHAPQACLSTNFSTTALIYLCDNK